MNIVSELGGTSVEPALNKIDVQLKSFPYPPYYNDPIITFLYLLLPFSILFGLYYTTYLIWSDVVLEKQRKLKVSVLRLFNLSTVNKSALSNLGRGPRRGGVPHGAGCGQNA